jgi:CcmD family protein
VTAEEKYVAAAYLVVFVFVLLYLLIISTKLARLERDVGELVERAREREAREREEPEVLEEVRRGHG